MMGTVTLIGGGPGPADLLTVRAARCLAHADVVCFDRLGPTEELRDLAPHAELIDVGKLPGYHRVPQEAINALLISHAQAGRRVARLKGGDPFVFGRGGEEINALTAAGISVDIIPGISSAISVPQSVGIPVTHRGISHTFTVMSGHIPPSEDQLRHLAGLDTTLVVLMGMGTLGHTVTGLLRHGLSPDTPAAIIERGFRASQRTTRAPLRELVREAHLRGCASPAVIVIGDVVHAMPQWVATLDPQLPVPGAELDCQVTQHATHASAGGVV